MDPLDPVFLALSDRTRRALMVLLARGGPATATGLASEFPVTRQAIAKHLQVLAEAGLAVSERVGRETRWTLQPTALVPAAAWIDELDRGFADRVADLQRHLERQRADRTGAPPAARPGFRPPLSAAASRHRRHPPSSS